MEGIIQKEQDMVLSDAPLVVKPSRRGFRAPQDTEIDQNETPTGFLPEKILIPRFRGHGRSQTISHPVAVKTAVKVFHKSVRIIAIK